jgi:predicted enzyme related to lactoylglutathione lyase
MSAVAERGRFVWYDLVTRDPARSIDFYTKVMGWGTQQWEMPGGGAPYTMWAAGDTPIGGVTPPEPDAAADAPSFWLAYVSVPDVQKTALEITGLGGRILQPLHSIPSVGTFTTFADPQGAVIAAFTPENSSPESPEPRLGEIVWHELMTTERERAFEYYQPLFGWDRIHDVDLGPMGTYMIYGRNGRALGGMYDRPPEMPMPPHWSFYVYVDDTVAALERVKANGGMVLNGPTDVPGSTVAQCLDPLGAPFGLSAATKSA